MNIYYLHLYECCGTAICASLRPNGISLQFSQLLDQRREGGGGEVRKDYRCIKYYSPPLQFVDSLDSQQRAKAGCQLACMHIKKASPIIRFKQTSAELLSPHVHWFYLAASLRRRKYFDTSIFFVCGLQMQLPATSTTTTTTPYFLQFLSRPAHAF